MNISFDLNLPTYNLEKPLCEPDYYGMSDLVSKGLQMDNIPISDAGWLHGWRFQDLKLPEEIVLPFFKHCTNQLVANTEQEIFLRQNGYKNSFAVGMPYTYAVDSDYWDNRKNVIPNSILVMPPHSLPGLDLGIEEEKYVRYLVEHAPQDAYLCFCVHQNCENNGKWINTLKKYNIPYVTGARIEDRNGLKRMVAIYSHFESMTTNSFGSHIIQAALCGLKVSVCGPFYNFKYEDVIKTNNWAYTPKYKQAYRHLIEGGEMNVLQKKYPFLFTEIKDATSHLDWAIKESGYDLKRPFEELYYLLRWDHAFSNKIDYYSGRYLRILKKEILRRVYS